MVKHYLTERMEGIAEDLFNLSSLKLLISMSALLLHDRGMSGEAVTDLILSSLELAYRGEQASKEMLVTLREEGKEQMLLHLLAGAGLSLLHMDPAEPLTATEKRLATIDGLNAMGIYLDDQEAP